MNKQKSKNFICATLIAVLSLLLNSGCTQVQKQTFVYNFDYKQVDAMFNDKIFQSSTFEKVEESEFISLYINGLTAEIMVEDKKTGKKWFSNPENRLEFDNIASGEGKDKLSSQINIDYNLNDAPQSYNSYTNSVENRQISYEKIENGIRVNYLFGDKPVQYFVPQVLSVERYNSIIALLNDENREILESNYKFTTLKDKNKSEKAVLSNMYPILNDRDCYIVMVTSAIGDPNKIYASDYIMKTLHDAFASGGYTKDDYIKDNIENLIKEAVKPDMTITASVEYKISGKDFIATIPNKSLTFDDNYIKVTKISLLPMFGAAQDDKNGYMFVPDGSGALINLNNKKYSMPSFSKMLYSKDNTLPEKTMETIDTSSMYMPVFGIKTDDRAFLAIIEKGDALAEITAEISGKISRYNTAFAIFNVNSISRAMTTSLGLNTGLKYQKKVTGSDLAIRYLLLTDNETNYSQMAKSYQTYLLDNTSIKKATITQQIPLSITTIGAVNTKRAVLGVPVDLPLSLTNYKQNLDIIESLKQKGVKDIILNMDSWSNNGVYNTNFNKLEIINNLGTNEDIVKLENYAINNNVDLFFGTEFEYIGKKTLFNGFNENKYGARTLENVAAYKYEYELATKSRKIDTKRNIVSPLFYQNIITEFLKPFSEFKIKSLALNSFGSDLNGDYNENKMVDRTDTKKIVSEQIKQLYDGGYRLSVNGGNVYSLYGTSLINGVPQKSGSSYIVDEYIPFYQMVVHGIIPYTSEPLNMSANYKIDALRLAETGTIPSFKWIFEDNLVLKSTDYNFYSVCYKSWIDKAAILYKDLNNNLAQCQDSTITRHEIIADGIRSTTFSNNKTVFVNYNDFDVDINGTKIGAKTYLVK